VPTSADFIEGSNISIGHLGIVAGAFDTLGIAGVIDRAIPKTRHHHLTHGDIVKAMVLNGLGFVEQRLYLYPEFFSDIAADPEQGEGACRCRSGFAAMRGRTLPVCGAGVDYAGVP